MLFPATAAADDDGNGMEDGAQMRGAGDRGEIFFTHINSTKKNQKQKPLSGRRSSYGM